MSVSPRRAFTLIEVLVVIAIIAILAVVVVLTLNPAELLRQSRDSNRVSDMATLTDALNLYVTDQAGTASFSLGNASDTYPSTYDPSATSTAGDQCQGVGMLSLNTSTGQAWQCAPSSTYRDVNDTGWIPVNFSNISAGSPIGSLPVDPTNQTSTGLFYAYNTNGNQFEVTATLESQKYKTQYGQSPQTSFFPEVISGGTPTVSALYNNTGLVGYWPLNEGSGSSTLDQSGNGDNGSWSGTPIGTGGTYYTGGKVGNYAGDFNGVNDYVNLGNPAALQLTTSISFVAWVRTTLNENGQAIIANSYGTSGPFYLYPYSGQKLFWKINNGAALAGAGSGMFVAGNWYQVVCTYNGSQMILYLNGAVVGTANYSGSLSYSNGYPWIIGGQGSGTTTNEIIGGSIDDVRIYNRALSAAEVMALYNAER